MTPVITSTDGRCVAMTRWMPTARAIWAMRQMLVLDVTGRDHHEVGQLVHDDHDERQPLVVGPPSGPGSRRRSPRSKAAL